jgi:aminopeptidase YwaD
LDLQLQFAFLTGKSNWIFLKVFFDCSSFGKIQKQKIIFDKNFHHMHRSKTPLLFFFTILTITSHTKIFGQLEAAKKIIQDLSAPEMHGRAYVNDGHKIAATYLAKEFKKTGLQKFGGSYFQKFPLTVNTQPAAMDLKIDGKTLVPGKDYLIDPSSPSLRGNFNCVVLKTADLLNENIFVQKLTKSKDKVILVDLYDLETQSKKAHAKILEIIRFLRYSDAHPAAAILIFSPKKLTWHSSTIQSEKPSFSIGLQVEIKKIQQVSIHCKSRFIKKTISQNVIGFLKGRVASDSLLVISAHYDHLGRMGKNTYFPGANDNASGVALLLQLAKHFSTNENRPKYSLVFVAFGAEELGLLGSKYFVNHPPFALKNIKFLLNFDLAGTGSKGIQVVNATVYPNQFKTLQALNQKQGYIKAIKPRGPACNSDHCSFDAFEVPCFYSYTLGGIAAYHDVYDRFETLPLTSFEGYANLMKAFVKSF